MNEKLIDSMEEYLEAFGEMPPRWNSPYTDEEFIQKINQAIKDKNPITEKYTREDIY